MRANKRCCSSTAAATRRSRCAAPAGTACSVRAVPPGWSSTAWSNACSATTADTGRACPGSVRRAPPRTPWPPADPASNAWPKRSAIGFPDARQAVAASDTLTGPRAAADLVRRIEERRVDVLIGTQIVAKGHHFPLLTLVGVVDADLGLAGGDLRAAERTYQLLYQVAGRAGRAERPGRVLVQTYMPESAVMQALVSGQRQRFLDAEAEDRRRAGMPPFGRLAALVVSGRDEGAVDEAARVLGRTAPRADGIQVLGPAPAPLALLRGRHRRRLLLKAGREVNVQTALRRLAGGRPVAPPGARARRRGPLQLSLRHPPRPMIPRPRVIATGTP